MKGLIGGRAIGLLAGSVLVLVGCERTTGMKSLRPVGIHVTASPSVAGSSATSGAVEITSLRLVTGTASLGATSPGGGDQFGCFDCQGNYQEGSVAPRVIDVPLGGGPVLVATDQVGPGHYSQAEISLEAPTAATLTGVSNWPGTATIVIGGRINGVAFTLPLTIVGSFRETLTPPVDVTAAQAQAPASVAVTITLPVASWFMSNGTVLDPSNPAQRAAIETNARSAFQPTDTGAERPEGGEGG